MAESFGFPSGQGDDRTDKKRIIELRGKSQRLKATVHIGKDGVAPALLREISAQLKKHKIVKVRLLNSFEGEIDEVGRQLASAVPAVLVETRGKTIVLAQD